MNNLVANHNEGLGPNGRFRANTPRRACLPMGGAKGSDESDEGSGPRNPRQSHETEGSVDQWPTHQSPGHSHPSPSKRTKAVRLNSVKSSIPPGRPNAGPASQAGRLGWRSQDLASVCSLEVAGSKCRIRVVNCCGLSTDESPTTLFMEEVFHDSWISFAQVIPMLYYGAELNCDGPGTGSKTTLGCQPSATVYSYSR